MTIHLYNTLTRKKEAFVPLDPDRVTMYVCGPTVYSFAHIGNARPAVVFDVLSRVLRSEYSNVVYARNLTDVDDKINAAALQEGVPISVITDRYTEIYHQDMQALGVALPDIEPRATDHIEDIIAMIESLLEKGFAYEAEGHVLFSVPNYARYGELSGRNREDMIAGARVEVAPYKKDPADFILWKPSNEDQPGWDSPWGLGRPGWHIECSCMIERHLGESIDIHGGGQDLIFPHHENEIAQGTCAHDGKQYCRYWLHNGFVNVDQEKMSKSIGNVLLVHELLDDMPGEVIRYALLSAHYRSPLDWNDELVKVSRRNLDRLYGVLESLQAHNVEIVQNEYCEPFLDALKDDINTPLALSELHALAKKANTSENEVDKKDYLQALLFCGEKIGLLQSPPSDWFAQFNQEVDAAMVEQKLAERQQARANKDFAAADQIRDELLAMDIEIKDTPTGATWRKL